MKKKMHLLFHHALLQIDFQMCVHACQVSSVLSACAAIRTRVYVGPARAQTVFLLASSYRHATDMRTYACMHVCMYACMHVCMYACMHECMNACMHVCAYACTHVCMYARMHVCMHACMREHAGPAYACIPRIRVEYARRLRYHAFAKLPYKCMLRKRRGVDDVTIRRVFTITHARMHTTYSRSVALAPSLRSMASNGAIPPHLPSSCVCAITRARERVRVRAGQPASERESERKREREREREREKERKRARERARESCIIQVSCR